MSQTDPDSLEVGGAASFATFTDLDNPPVVIGKVDGYVFGVLKTGEPLIEHAADWPKEELLEWATSQFLFYQNVAAKLMMFTDAVRKYKADSANAEPSKPSPESEKSAND